MKIMLSGRFFVIRYILSVGTGELIDTVLVFSIGLIGILTLKEIVIIIANAYLYKILFAVLLAKPADWITKFLKKKENCDVFDNGISYSPFNFKG